MGQFGFGDKTEPSPFVSFGDKTEPSPFVTSVTDKQREAMEEAEVDFVYQTIYEITEKCLLKLL